MAFITGHVVMNIFLRVCLGPCSPLSSLGLSRSVMQLMFRNLCMPFQAEDISQGLGLALSYVGKQDTLLFATLSAAFLRVCFLLPGPPAA